MYITDKNKCVSWIITVSTFIALMLFSSSGLYGATNVIKKVSIQGKSESVQVTLQGKSVSKVIQIDSKEVLVAFKNVMISPDYTSDYGTSELVDYISIEKLPNHVVALVITTTKNISEIQTKWNTRNTLFSVELLTGLKEKQPVSVPVSKPPVTDQVPEDITQSSDKDTVAVQKPEKKEPSIPVEVKSEIPKNVSLLPSKYQGDIDDFITDARDDMCYESFELRPVIKALNRERWNQLYELTETIISEGNMGSCSEFLYYLRGYSFKMMDDSGSPQSSLAIIPMLNEALHFYPESRYKPYSMLMLAKAYLDLNNSSMAKGYLELIYDKYDLFPGTPELLFRLGKIYNNDGLPDLAIISFQKIISNYTGTDIIPSAKIELGKALFKKKHFIDSLTQLNEVRETDYRKIYDNEDLLLYIGNANHELGRSAEARAALIKVLNIYPDIDEKDIILTHIGDTYANENQIDKALKIYRIVTKQFVGTDGFIISSIRLARYIKDRQEKETIYRMIIDEYPEHDMFRLAMMRLGELQYQYKEYENSLNTMHEFLESNPRSLRLEVYELMEKCYVPLFFKLQKEDRFPEILIRYERDKKIIDDFENPDIFLSVGHAYLKGYLYENAFNSYMSAYRLLNKDERPGDLLADLAYTMKETGRYDGAVKMYENFIKYFPGNSRKSEAYKQTGEVYLNLRKYEESLNYFKNALKSAKKADEKAEIQIKKALAYKGQKKFNLAVPVLISAINNYSTLAESFYPDVSSTYILLGDIYMEQDQYRDAVDSYEMSMKFADNKSGMVGTLFNIGEAYRLDTEFENAKKAYNDIIALDDPFWGKMALERIKEIDLSLRLKQT